MKSITLDYDENEFILQFLEDFRINWSANFHLKVLTIYEMFRKSNIEDSGSTITTTGRSVLNQSFYIQSNTVNNIIDVKISDRHQMRLIFDGLIVSLTSTFFHFELAHLQISIDNDFDVFEINGLCWRNMENDDGIRVCKFMEYSQNRKSKIKNCLLKYR